MADKTTQAECGYCSNNQGSGCMFGLQHGVCHCDRGFTEGEIFAFQKKQRRRCATTPEDRAIACGQCKLWPICNLENGTIIKYPTLTLDEIKSELHKSDVKHLAERCVDAEATAVRVIPNKDHPTRATLVVEFEQLNIQFTVEVEGDWNKIITC